MSTYAKLDILDNVALITLSRPNVANALSQPLLADLNAKIESVNNNTSIYCTILTGAGEKAFSAGADLKERKNMDNEEVIEAVHYIGETATQLENMKMPIIAAINGAAYGGGLELALACDFRIATNQAKMGLTETSLAIIPGAGGTQRLSRIIGPSQAKRLIYTAKTISASEALKIGLVEQLTDRNALLRIALNIGKTITKNGPLALKQAKAAIDQGLQTSLKEGLEIEHSLYKELIPTHDRLEGLKAFKEKREPTYNGE